MIRINLLPHREEKRKRRQQQFQILAGISAVLALLVGGAVWLYLDSQVTAQRANVAYMKAEIDKLDKQIEEIRKIREETASLLAKKQVVEGLQSNRSEPVQLLDQLLRQLPEGVSSRRSSSRPQGQHQRLRAVERARLDAHAKPGRLAVPGEPGARRDQGGAEPGQVGCARE
jgi:Tfp pilus assembly protein PilN